MKIPHRPVLLLTLALCTAQAIAQNTNDGGPSGFDRWPTTTYTRPDINQFLERWPDLRRPDRITDRNEGGGCL